MKSVLISIQPKWCELIASGKKTVEVRKTRPKIDEPFKCYIYCTLSGSNEFFKEDCSGDIAEWNRSRMALKKGKVIGEFVCDEIIPIRVFENGSIQDYMYQSMERSCVPYDEISEYIGKGRIGYGWHISDLVIYDELKGLHHFFKPCGNCDKKGTRRCTEELTDCRAKVITRPPQSWCYVEELKGE